MERDRGGADDALANEWRRLGRLATVVAVLTTPAVYAIAHHRLEWGIGWSILTALASIAVFRGAVDVLAHKLVPFPALEQDFLSRRRHWYWKTAFRRAAWLALLVGIAFSIALAASDGTFSGAADRLGEWGEDAALLLAALVALLILFASLFFVWTQQIKSSEPGDADWGVKLADVRGQAEAKEEIQRVVTLWESGHERGALLLGAPGTGKTMLSKAIATSLSCPFVTIPGSAFQHTVVDALIVRHAARKAKRLAAKWGGRCIVLLDEIDAVGMRRAALDPSFQPLQTGTIHDHLFYGEWGALTWDGDLVKETRAWRDRVFALRTEPKPGTGSQALNQLLVVMDGIDAPAQRRTLLTNTVNGFLDATYIVPQRIRLRPPRRRAAQIHFIGASSVPLPLLDPALTRPGRLGRQIHFRTPTWEDRRDVLDLYLGRVAHEDALDTPKARDELARITAGHSPPMIDQLCSLALTCAHADGRPAVARRDLLEAMVTVEAGVAVGQPHPEHEERATAIHEAGHAVCAHLYMENGTSTRLSIRRRGHTGGHHRMAEIEDRFGHWRSEEVADLIWGLGALAAEHVFYDQNTTGVGGDLGSVTHHSAHMVSLHGMAPAPIDLADRIADRDEREREEQRVLERFEKLGYQLMHRSGSSTDSAPYTASMGDPEKRRLVAGLLGQSFVIAWNTIRENRKGTEYVAERLIDAGELYGDDVVALLDGARLRKPTIDVLDESSWPAI